MMKLVTVSKLLLNPLHYIKRNYLLVESSNEKNGSVINISAGILYSVEEIIEICFKTMKNRENIIYENIERKNEIANVKATINKTKLLLIGNLDIA